MAASWSKVHCQQKSFSASRGNTNRGVLLLRAALCIVLAAVLLAPSCHALQLQPSSQSQQARHLQQTPAPSGAAASCQLPPPVPFLGVEALTLQSLGDNPDDGSLPMIGPEVQQQLPFSFSYLSSQWDFTDMFVSGNAYITFGVPAYDYYNLDAGTPPVPTWFLGAADNVMAAVYSGLSVVHGETVLRLRWEGYSKSQWSDEVILLKYEVTFFSGQRVALAINTLDSRLLDAEGDTTFWGMSDGQGTLLAELTPCQLCSYVMCSNEDGSTWRVEQVPPPPFPPPSPPPPPPPPMIAPSLFEAGGIFHLSDVSPSSSVMYWQSQLTFVASDAANELMLDGHLPDSIQPAAMSVEWRNSRQRMIVDCSLGDPSIWAGSMAAIEVQQRYDSSSPSQLHITLRNIHFISCPSVVSILVGGPSITNASLTVENCVFSSGYDIPSDPAPAQVAIRFESDVLDPTAAYTRAASVSVLDSLFIGHAGRTVDSGAVRVLTNDISLVVIGCQFKDLRLWPDVGSLLAVGQEFESASGHREVTFRQIEVIGTRWDWDWPSQWVALESCSLIHIDASSVTLEDINITDNEAEHNCPMLVALSPSITVTNAVLSQNTIVYHAADGYDDSNPDAAPSDLQPMDALSCSMFVFKGALSLQNCSVLGNVVYAFEDSPSYEFGECPILYSLGDGAHMQSSVFNNNHAANAGIVRIVGDYCRLENNRFENNTGHRAALYASTTRNDMFEAFGAYFGGNPYIYDDPYDQLDIYRNSRFTMDNCSFVNNTNNDDYGTAGGGAVSLDQWPVAVIRGTSFFSNTAENGGAVYATSTLRYQTAAGDWALWAGYSDYMVGMSDCDFTGNRAAKAGGALHGPSFHVSRTVFRSNVAEEGGATWTQTLLFLRNTTLSDNQAAYGGAVYVREHATLLMGYSTSLSNNHASVQGGAVFMHISGYAIFRTVAFSGNSALLGGAVALASGVKAQFGECTMFNNTAEQLGGWLHSALLGNIIISNCIFDQNAAGQDGGTLHIASSGHLDMQECSVTRSRALQGRGGVLLLDSASAAITASNFSGNWAAQDGGVTALDTYAQLSMDACQLWGNGAAGTGAGPAAAVTQRGGAVHVDGGSNVSMLLVHLWDNAAAAGGAVSLQQATSLFLNSSELHNNIASTGAGGAVWALAANVTVINCNLTANRASTDGGAVWAGNGSVVLTRVQLDCNVAVDGDGGAVAASGGAVQLASSHLGNNAAGGLGGGLWLGADAAASLSSTALLNNTAGTDGGGAACESCSLLRLADGANVAGNMATLGSGGGLFLQPVASEHRYTSSVSVVDATVAANGASRGGGVFISNALCKPPTSPAAQPTPCVHLANSTIVGNSAWGTNGSPGRCITTHQMPTLDGLDGMGGGLLVDLVDAPGDMLLEGIQIRGNCAPLGGGTALRVQHCSSTCMLLRDMVVAGNTAANLTNASAVAEGATSSSELFLWYGGGSGGVQVHCGNNSSLPLSDLFNRGKPAATTCPAASGLRDALGHSTSAPYAMRLVGAQGTSVSQAPGSAAAGADLQVASRVPFSLMLEVVDVSGDRVRLTLAEPMRLVVTAAAAASGRQVILRGGTTLQVTDLRQSLEIQDLGLEAYPGQYVLTIQAPADVITYPAMNIMVSVQDCVLGEERDGDACRSCGSSGFNLDPGNSNCSSCPAHAICQEGLLFPEQGYWHSSPKSPQMHRCPVRSACNVANKMASNGTHLQAMDRRAASTRGEDDAFLQAYQTSQCNTKAGYEGPLCAVCAQGYGPFGTSCKKCPSRVTAVIAIILISIVQAIIIAAQVVLFFASLRRAANSPLQANSPVPLPMLPVPDAGGPQQEECNDIYGGQQAFVVVAASHNADTQLMPYGLLEHIPVFSKSQQSADDSMAATPPPPSASQSQASSGVALQGQGSSAEKIAVGVLKLVLQYVQLLGIMQGIDLDAPTQIVSMLTSMDVTTSATSQLLYCSLTSSGEDRMVKYFLTSTLTPALFVAAAAAAVFLVPLIICKGRLVGGRHLKHASATFVVSTLATCIFFYPSVTNQLLRIFAFVRLDQHTDVPGAVLPYLGMYWREYASQRYAAGPHRALLLTVGVPGLLLFSIGFPSMLLLVLLQVRRRLQEKAIRRHLGLVYDDYHPQACYWQVVVLLVQLLLTLCAVLLSGLGAHVQLLSAQVVVVLYSYVHGIVQPFCVGLLSALAQVMYTCLVLSLVLLLYLASVRDEAARLSVVVVFMVVNGFLVLGMLGIMGWYVFVAVRERGWFGMGRQQCSTPVAASSTPTAGCVVCSNGFPPDAPTLSTGVQTSKAAAAAPTKGMVAIESAPVLDVGSRV